MDADSSLPIALRRGRRQSAAHARDPASSPPPPKPTPRRESRAAAAARTPATKRGTKRRVRFSDPGPEIQHDDDDDDSHQALPTATANTTGLTPMLDRTAIRGGGAAASTPSSKRRRRSAPAAATATDQQDRYRHGDEQQHQQQPVCVVPLRRQLLSPRLQRRIRRNGLSEEMNAIHGERRARARSDRDEIARLRAEIAERDDEIERCHDSTVAQDTDRILELERLVDSLRAELGRASTVAAAAAAAAAAAEDSDNRSHEWTLAARDPLEEYHDDDARFGDSTMADLVCSTPSRGSRNKATVSGGSNSNSNLQTSFPSPPPTSPTMPFTPFSARSNHSTALLSFDPPAALHLGVQTPFRGDDGDAEQQQQQQQQQQRDAAARIEQEEEANAALRTELAELGRMFDAQSRLQRRLSAKLVRGLVAPGSSAADCNHDKDTTMEVYQDEDVEREDQRHGHEHGHEHGHKDKDKDSHEEDEEEEDGDEDQHPANLEPLVDAALRALADKTAALAHLGASLGDLGFFSSSSSPSPSDDNNDPSAAIAVLAAHLRSLRLALERADPGESALPLNSAGPAVLTAAGSTLASLAARCREADASVDEYHALELSLRQQLGGAVRRDGGMRGTIEGLRAAQAELEGRCGRLKRAAEMYRADCRAAERAAEGAEAEGRRRAAREVGARAAEALRGRDGVIAGLRREGARAGGEVGRLWREVCGLRAQRAGERRRAERAVEAVRAVLLGGEEGGQAEGEEEGGTGREGEGQGEEGEKQLVVARPRPTDGDACVDEEERRRKHDSGVVLLDDETLRLEIGEAVSATAGGDGDGDDDDMF